MGVIFDICVVKKEISTCIEYSDWLQNTIDNLIWIAYVKTSDEGYKEKEMV